MADSSKDCKFPLKVYVNKEKNKVLYAVGDHQFVDILLSFITLPLGRIVKILEKHDEATHHIGSLNSLYRSIANLPTYLFWDARAKRVLLEQRSSFEAEYERLMLDVAHSPPAPQYFVCTRCHFRNTFRSVSIYYTDLKYCRFCKTDKMISTKQIRRSGSRGCAAFVANNYKTSFVISDDLQILPNETGLLRIIKILGISNIDDQLHENEIKVNLGFNEIMNLLKASMTSETPLSDVILNKTARLKHSATVESQLKIENEENGSSNTDKYLSLKLMIQKSTGKFLYAEAKEKFIEFLFSLLIIPAGRAENLVAAAAGEASLKGINNLYRSTCEFIDDEYFRTPAMKNRLMKLKLPHGYISEDRMILPLVEECLPGHYTEFLSSFSSTVFPKGKGSYLEGPRTYQVMDDLTVTPFCFVSILSRLREQEIQLSDVKEVELQIGLKEALCILKASLTSTSAITDALLSRIPNKIPKREV